LGLATHATWLIVAYFHALFIVGCVGQCCVCTGLLFLGAPCGLVCGQPVFWPLVVMSAVLIWRHQANIAQVDRGKKAASDKCS
jgi:glycerol-3-phosphate acyltransferase PlsY